MVRKYFVTEKQLKYMIKEGYTKEYRERAKEEYDRRLREKRKNYMHPAKEEYDRRLREKRKNYMHPTVTKKIEKLMRRRLI